MTLLKSLRGKGLFMAVQWIKSGNPEPAKSAGSDFLFDPATHSHY
jgi:hypothetical protein